MRTTADQIRAVAAAQAVGVGVLVQGASWGLLLLGAATVVQLGLGKRLLVLVETRHDLCRELIAGGAVALDLPVVRRERHRLADRRHRARLAHPFDEVGRAASRSSAPAPGSTPCFNLRVVRPVGVDLREIAALLRGDDARVRGVALAERLLTLPGSPLGGSDARRLAEELARIGFLLVTDEE